jgi:GNAT superfamily N-acetyltransferase
MRAARADPVRPDPVEIVVGTVDDTEAVLAMLSRCSRRALFHRFHGFSDGVAHAHVVLAEEASSVTLLGRRDGQCIALATLAHERAGGTGHVGVLVEDHWQRHGVGLRMITSLVEDARRRGLRSIHADVLGEDQFLLALLSRFGSLIVSIEQGAFCIDVELEAA